MDGGVGSGSKYLQAMRVVSRVQIIMKTAATGQSVPTCCVALLHMQEA